MEQPHSWRSACGTTMHSSCVCISNITNCTNAFQGGVFNPRMLDADSKGNVICHFLDCFWVTRDIVDWSWFICPL